MKLLKKLLAGGFLAFGGFFWLAALLIPFSGPREGQTLAQAQQENQSAALGCLILGAPPIAIGGWLVWDLGQRQRREQAAVAKATQNQLRQCLMELIEQGNGGVTLFEFAMKSGLEAPQAREYLDRIAIEFGADCQIGDHGETSYQFPIK